MNIRILVRPKNDGPETEISIPEVKFLEVIEKYDLSPAALAMVKNFYKGDVVACNVPYSGGRLLLWKADKIS